MKFALIRVIFNLLKDQLFSQEQNEIKLAHDFSGHSKALHASPMAASWRLGFNEVSLQSKILTRARGLSFIPTPSIYPSTSSCMFPTW
jgi:hypothetical protein